MLAVAGALAWGKGFADHQRKQTQPVGFVDTYGVNGNQQGGRPVLAKDDANPLLDNTYHVASTASTVVREAANAAGSSASAVADLIKLMPYLAVAFVGFYGLQTLNTGRRY
jgi:hypothetical protein